MTMNNNPSILLENGEIIEPDSVVPHESYLVAIDSQTKEYYPWHAVTVARDELRSEVHDA